LLDDGGFAAEYNTLRNWVNWTGMDKNSVVYDFNKDMVDREHTFYHSTDRSGVYAKRRMNDNMHKTVSMLNRGQRLNYVPTDIDGVERTTTGKVFDIGAIEFYSKKWMTDIEIRNIHSPAAYQGRAPFNDAEYVMLRKMQGNNQTVPVRVFVRNNGQTFQANIPVTATVIGSGAPAPETQLVSLAPDQEKEVVFFTRASNQFKPRPYGPGGTVPARFASMRTTVTDTFRITVSTTLNDENPGNNFTTSTVRFFVPQSELNLLISAENSHANLYTGNNPVVTNQETVAGKLNFDTVVAALGQLHYFQTTAEGKHHFDVLERTAWEPRSVDYSVYKGVIWSDGHDKELTYWQKQNLIDFTNIGTPSRKTSLIVASQEMLRENNDFVADRFNVELQDNVIRARDPRAYTTTPIAIKGKDQNTMFVIDVDRTTYSVGDFSDDIPRPSRFNLIDTAFGQNFIAYYFYNKSLSNPDASTVIRDNISSVSAKTLTRNVSFTAVDWRHLRNASAFLGGIFNDFGDDIFSEDEWLTPIELVSFNATPIGRKVVLDWITATESNTSHFEVERANVVNSLTDIFNTVGKKQASGFTNTNTSYNLFDDNVQFGNRYAYRLKINDFNGDFTYSPIQEVSIEYADGVRFGEPVPNPTSDITTVDFALDKEARVRISLHDLTGKEVMLLADGILPAGAYPIEINVSKLSSGTYNLMYVIDGKLITKSTIINVVK